MKSLCSCVCVVLVNFFTQSSSCPYTFTLHFIFTRGDLGMCLDFNWVIWTRACQISNIKCCVDKPESQVPSHIYDGEMNFANLQNAAADDIICVTILYSVVMVSYTCSYRLPNQSPNRTIPRSKSPKSHIFIGGKENPVNYFTFLILKLFLF